MPHFILKIALIPTTWEGIKVFVASRYMPKLSLFDETTGLNTIASYTYTMATTIQVSSKLLEELKSRKMYDNESYENIIWDLLEDSLELSEEAKKLIKQAEEDFKKGRTRTLEELKKELGL